MYRKPSDAVSSGVVKTSDKAKAKPKPKVAIKRTGSAGATGSAGVGGSVSAAAGGVNGAAAAPAARKRPTKLRAPRERRARDRSMDDDEDLEHKFSNLSFTAPAFVPGGKPLASTGTASTPPSLSVSSNARGNAPTQVPLLQGRSLAFVTERATGKPSSTAVNSNLMETGTGFSLTKRTPPPRRTPTPETLSTAPSLRSLAAAPTDAQTQEKTPIIGRPNIERRPRRQRIGAMGFSKSSAPGGMQGRVTRQSNAGSSGPSLSLKPRLTDDTASSSSSTPSSSLATGSASSAFPQRPRSDSAGSDSDYGSDDEVYPEDQGGGASSAFPDRLTLFSQQKRIPKKYVPS